MFRATLINWLYIPVFCLEATDKGVDKKKTGKGVVQWFSNHLIYWYLYGCIYRQYMKNISQKKIEVDDF